MIHRWWQLAIRNWRARFTRTLLESIAVVIACALVTLLTGAFASAERSVRNWQEQWLGKVDVQVSSVAGEFMIDEAIGKLRLDDIQLVAVGLNDRAQLRIAGDASVSVSLHGREIPKDTQIHPRSILDGRPLSDPDGYECVVGSGVAKEFGVAVGDEVELLVYNDATTFTVVGVYDSPSLTNLWHRVYVPLATAQKILDRAGEGNTLYVQFAADVDVDAATERLASDLGEEYRVLRGADRRARAEENIALWRSTLVLLSGLLLLLAMLLVFATLSSAMVRRVSEMGTLRCVGASRWQLAAMVLVESLPIAAWGVVVGVPLGVAGSQLVVHKFPDVFRAGWVFDPWGVVLAAMGTLVATLGGGLLPAVAAARTSPMQAYRVSGRSGWRWTVLVAAAIGLVFAAVPMMLVRSAQDVRTAMFGHVFVGLPAFAAGLLLLAPAILALVAWPIGSLAARTLGIARSLVVRQIGRARWRHAAIVTAVAICIALVVSAHTETESLINGSRQLTDFPDLVIGSPKGFRVDEAEEAFAALEIPKDRWTGLNPFKVDHVGGKRRSRRGLDERLFPALSPGGNSTYFAIEPYRFKKISGMDFVAGDGEQAAARMAASEDVVIITQAFSRERKVRVGEFLPLRRVGELPEGEGRPIVKLEVVGVVSSISMEVAGAQAGLGKLLMQNSATVMLGSMAVGKKHFNQGNYSILLIDVSDPETGDPDVAGGKEVVERLRARWSDRPIESVSLSTIRTKVEKQLRGLTFVFTAIGGTLAAAVASVGVANAMQAGVHGRRRELGVLHAVGMTRWQLVRMVLAESCVLATAGTIMGVAAGFYTATIGMRIHELLLGQSPTFTVPRDWKCWAMVLALGAATVAAGVVAARQAGRADVLRAMRE